MKTIEKAEEGKCSEDNNEIFFIDDDGTNNCCNVEKESDVRTILRGALKPLGTLRRKLRRSRRHSAPEFSHDLQSIEKASNDLDKHSGIIQYKKPDIDVKNGESSKKPRHVSLKQRFSFVFGRRGRLKYVKNNLTLT